jgi:hypothetical protein
VSGPPKSDGRLRWSPSPRRRDSTGAGHEEDPMRTPRALVEREDPVAPASPMLRVGDIPFSVYRRLAEVGKKGPVDVDDRLRRPALLLPLPEPAPESGEMLVFARRPPLGQQRNPRPTSKRRLGCLTIGIRPIVPPTYPRHHNRQRT